MADADRLNLDFARNHPGAFAKIVGRGDTGEIVSILNTLPSGTAASIIARLPTPRVIALLASGQQDETKWLADAPLDDTIMLLSRIPRENCLSLVNSLSDDERRHTLLQYLKYPAHSLGALVSALPVRIVADTLASDALAELRGLDSADPGLLAVVDRDGRYLGTVDLWALLSRDPPSGMIRDYTVATPALHPETSLLSAIEDADWHHNNCLPVIDHEEHLLGAVSRASVFAAATEYLDDSQPDNDFFQTLLEDLVHFLGDVLDRVLGKKSTT